jgi:hypothetical protein
MSREHKYDQISIDTETLATTADAVIMSIGAVKFNLLTGEPSDEAFYASISIDSQTGALHRRINESTVVWWMGQNTEAKKVFTEPKDTIEVALINLSDWFDHEDYEVWSNGADFDIPMLTHAYSQFDQQPPWKYYNSRCYRTLKKLYPAVYASTNPGAHNALADALCQATHTQRILRQGQPLKKAA